VDSNIHMLQIHITHITHYRFLGLRYYEYSRWEWARSAQRVLDQFFNFGLEQDLGSVELVPSDPSHIPYLGHACPLAGCPAHGKRKCPHYSKSTFVDSIVATAFVQASGCMKMCIILSGSG
jgi:hypothetical protein